MLNGHLLKLRDFHPERVLLGAHTRKWPKPVRQAASFFVAFAGWYGITSAALAVLSSLSYLKAVWSWLKTTALEIHPQIVVIFDALHAVIEIWRIITRPVYHLLFGWLPFDVPRSVLDVMIIFSIIFAGYFRSWIQARPYRQFLKMMDSDLSIEGRVALVKRIVASVDAISRGLNSNDASMADKGEHELQIALDEVTLNADPVQFLEVLEGVMDMPPDELQPRLMQVAMAALHEKRIWAKIFGRSIAVALILLGLVTFDIYWMTVY